MKKKVSIFWFRRDLRLEDNAGLYHALRSGDPVLPLFIFDQNILNKLSNKKDARVQFIHNALSQINAELKDLGSKLNVYFGHPEKIWKKLTEEFEIAQVFTNHDYEPYAHERDAQIEKLLASKNISIQTFKDQCVFEKSEVTKDDGKPYTVFTPYKNKWLKALTPFYYRTYPTKKYFNNFYKQKHESILSLEDIGFQKSDIPLPDKKVPASILKNYDKQRDFPALDATSHLGIHFRFGTTSIRKAVATALKTNDTWLSELIWRDFFMQILWHFPHVAKGAFRPDYDKIPWLNNLKEFQAWCDGLTGYPMVDAGMRELNATGHMHNRVRMVVASFLTKHLLIDWRWGEKYFAEKLLDFDLSANNGNWQWAAGTGCDAAPYFRVFNPEEQLKKFDPKGIYTKKWVPEWGTPEYPQPIVEHKMARVRAIDTYKKALG